LAREVQTECTASVQEPPLLFTTMPSDAEAGEKCFYMNFKLLNIAEAFPKIIRAKLRQSGKNDFAVTTAGKTGQFLAQRPKFRKKFSNNLADKLTSLMPPQLEEKGITLKLSKVDQGETGFIVLRAEVVDVDLKKLLETAKGSEFADKVAPLIGMARWFKDIDKAAVPMVQQQLMVKFETEIPNMLWEKARFKMLMICKSSSAQAEFYFDAVAPHRLAMHIKLLNKAELVAKLAEQKVGSGGYLGKAVGAVASKVTGQLSDERISKIMTRKLSRALPAYMADAGVTLTVTEGFTAKDQCGITILNCDIEDVDLSTFRTAAGAELGAMAADQLMLKLGHAGRSQVYEAVRNYLREQFPQYTLKEKGAEIEVLVKDKDMAPPSEMAEIEGLSDSDEPDEGEA